MRAEPRSFARRALRGLIESRARDLASNELLAPAVVIAPHFDDEVLGCGGTILRKRDVGADVTLIFMTNGGKSHRHLMPEVEVARIRAEEAVRAAGTLGIESSRIVMLGFDEGRLDELAPAATAKVAALLQGMKPQQVFCPYYRDMNTDHEATNRVACRAVEMSGLPIVVFEYPVWAWHLWPWCPAVLPSRSDLPAVAWTTAMAGFRFCSDMRIASLVGPFVDDKMKALREYRSQTIRLVDDPRWMTLSDVGGGDFLRALSTDREFFRLRRISQES